MKKLLFIVISLVFGLLVIVYGMNRVSSSVLNGLVKDSIKEKNYTYAEQFYTYITGDDSLKIDMHDFEDGAHIEVFEALSIRTTKLSVNGEIREEKALEETMFVALYNYQKFALTDAEGKKGGLTIEFSDDSEEFYPFNNAAVTTGDHAGLNYYQYGSYYGFMFMPLYPDFDSGLAITNITFTDGNGDNTYSYELDKPLDNNFHQVITSYGVEDKTILDLALEYNELSKTNQPNSKEVQTVIESITKAVKDHGHLLLQHNNSIVTKTAKYIVWVIVIVVLFVGVDALIGFFIFRKKPLPKNPPKHIPPANYRTLQKEKNIQKEDVIDVKSEEVKAEEENKEEE